jgi:hypothetical protein
LPCARAPRSSCGKQRPQIGERIMWFAGLRHLFAAIAIALMYAATAVVAVAAVAVAAAAAAARILAHRVVVVADRHRLNGVFGEDEENLGVSRRPLQELVRIAAPELGAAVRVQIEVEADRVGLSQSCATLHEPIAQREHEELQWEDLIELQVDNNPVLLLHFRRGALLHLPRVGLHLVSVLVVL